uniref:Protein TsetseEP domain-containing protein n=1 Tax=Clastoptera arizonana TaxID=38151 RepID=A0A1B6BZI5_9HEMI
MFLVNFLLFLVIFSVDISSGTENDLKNINSEFLNKLDELMNNNISQQSLLNILKKLTVKKRSTVGDNNAISTVQNNSLKQFSGENNLAVRSVKSGVTDFFSACNVSQAMNDVSGILLQTVNISATIAVEFTTEYAKVLNCTNMGAFAIIGCVMNEIGKIEGLLPETVDLIENYFDYVKNKTADIIQVISSCFGFKTSNSSQQIRSFLKEIKKYS